MISVTNSNSDVGATAGTNNQPPQVQKIGCDTIEKIVKPNIEGKHMIIRRNLDYFSSHLRMTQITLNGQDNHITVLALEGDIDRNCFKKSSEALFQAHPNLRVKKIEHDELNGLFFIQQELAFSDVSCEFIKISKDNDWRQWLSEQLSRPFPDEGPYWKVYCLTVKNTNPPRHYLVQCFDHSLCDGISTAKLQDELLTYYQLLREGQEIKKVSVNPPASPALLFSEELQYDWKTLKQHQDLLAIEYPPLAKGTFYERSVPLVDRSTQAVLFAFKLNSINKVCKERNKTVNDVLVSAGLLALRDIGTDEKLNTSVLTCVNLRNFKFGLGDKLNANQLACLFNVVVHPQKVENGEDLFTTAQNYHERMSLFIDQVGRPPYDFSIEEMRDRYGINSAVKRNYFSGGLASSNLGKVDIKRSYGSLDVMFYQFFTNQGAGFFEVLLDIVCVEDILYCNVTYVEPLRTHQWALQFVSHFIRHLDCVLPNKLSLIQNATDQDLLDMIK